MDTFESLMKDKNRWSALPGIRADENPLHVEDALREAQILDVRCECVTQCVGILLEMRMAFSGGENRAALLVGQGVTELDWKCSREQSDDDAYLFGMAWNVASSLMTQYGTLLKLELDCIPNAGLSVTARGFEYYLAEIPGPILALPDYTEGSDDTVRSNLPDWKRPLTILGSSYRVAE